MVREREALRILAFSRATLWRKVKHDPGFPRPFKLSEGITVWAQSEILDWIDAKRRA